VGAIQATGQGAADMVQRLQIALLAASLS